MFVCFVRLGFFFLSFLFSPVLYMRQMGYKFFTFLTDVEQVLVLLICQVSLGFGSCCLRHCCCLISMVYLGPFDPRR